MKSIARYQAKLLVRSPIFAICVVVLFVVVTVGVVDRTSGLPSAPVKTAVAAVGSMYEMALLVFMLLAAWAGAMTRSGRAADMVDSYLHSNTQMVIGQAIGLISALAAVWLGMLVWGTGLVWVLFGRMPVNITPAVELFLGQLLPSTVMAVGLGYAVGYGLRMQAAAYPVTAALWFALVMGSMALARSIPLRWLGVLEMTTVYDFDRGFTICAVIAVGLLGVGLAAGLVKRGREAAVARRRTSHAVLVVAVALFVLALGSSWLRWAPRAEASRRSVEIAEEEVRYFWGLPEGIQPQLRPATDVRSYDMEIRLSPKDGILENEVVMHVVNRGDVPLSVLTFTLRAEFAVEQCEVKQGDAWRDVDCARPVSWLRIRLDRPLDPGDGCRVRVRYAGVVEDWTLGRFLWFNSELNSFIHHDSAWIPAGSAWYPIAGTRLPRYTISTDGVHGIGRPQDDVAPSRLRAVWVANSHPAARMRVTVHSGMGAEAAVDMGIPGALVSGGGESAAYVFESDWARDLYLGAGALCPRRSDLDVDDRSYLSRMWAFLQDLAPSGGPVVVANLPVANAHMSDSNLVPQGVIPMRDEVLQRLAKLGDGGALSRGSSYDRQRLASVVTGAWWPAGAMRGDLMSMAQPMNEANLFDGVCRYARVLLFEHIGDMDEAAKTMQDNLQPLNEGVRHYSESQAEAISMLDRVRREVGEGAVRRVFSVLRAGEPGRDGVVTRADLEAAIDAAVQEVGRQ